MPEGDAVWRTARRLTDGLVGHAITDWDIRWGAMSTSDKRGRVSVEVGTYGKHILHRLDDGWTLHSHLRMEGSWQVKAPAHVRPSEYASGWLRALVGCQHATALGFRLGMVDLVRTGQEATLIGHLGPDLLGEWDAARAVANLKQQPTREIGAALLDQRNLAGIGTIWDSEVCFLSRVCPWDRVEQLCDEQLISIVGTAHVLLREAIEFPFSVSTGELKRPTYVYERLNQPCRRCQTAVATGMVGQAPQRRRIFFCRTCQQPMNLR